MRFILFLLLAPLLSFGQKVEGVVTYKSEDIKPDIGATVYIIDSSSIGGINANIIDTFYWANSFWDSYVKLKKYNEDIKSESITNAINEVYGYCKKYGVVSDLDFELLDRRSMPESYRFQISKNTKKTTVDGTGKYSYALSKSVYYLMIVSANLTGFSSTESRGKIFFKKIRIEDAEPISVSHNFK